MRNLYIIAIGIAIVAYVKTTNTAIEEGLLQKKTALAYGVDVPDVKIVEQSGSMGNVIWTANINGEKLTCRMTRVIVINSNAVCTKSPLRALDHDSQSPGRGSSYIK